MKEGQYFYHFVVDGQVRFAPDQPSTIDHDQKIVNFIDIDSYMIAKAEEAMDEHKKVKNMAECMASEGSWHLTRKFELTD